MLELKEQEWIQAVKYRHSTRKYNGRPVNEDQIKQLNDFIADLNRDMKGARVALVLENPDRVFKGIIGSYGKIKNHPACAAFIGDMSDPNVQEKVGYIGECLILEATARGLSTCWVGGFFKPEAVKEQVNIGSTEKVLAVTPIGYSADNISLEENIIKGIVASHNRKPLGKLCPGPSHADRPEWITAALEAARLAPSAINRQPWRFTVKEDSIKVSVDSTNFEFGVSKRLDCGIAMLHFEIGALSKGVAGEWEYLESPDVAVFRTR